MGLFDSIAKLALPIGGFLLGGPGGAAAGAAVSGAISGAKAEGKANKLSEEALRTSQRRDAELAPWHAKLSGLAGKAFQPEREDLSALFADPGNPYARVLQRPTMPNMPQSPNTIVPSTPLGRLRPRGGPVPLGGRGREEAFQ